MTPSANQPRTTRTRIIVAGESEAVSMLRARLADRALSADNLFDAIGHAAGATSSRPISAVVIASNLLRESSDEAINALRSVDPALQVIALCEAGGMTPDIPLIDGVINSPLKDDDLDCLLQGRPLPPPTSNNGAPPPEITQSRAISTEKSEPVSTFELSDTETLGDTDLVSAVQRQPENLADLAIALMTQQTGWTDLQLLKSDDADTPSGVPIQQDDIAFGVLHSAQASREELQLWAAWLAHWLALRDEQMRLRELAYCDHLTGAFNRRFFDAFLAEKIIEARQRRQALTIMVFDLDNFKAYNDTFGHEAGDDVLIETVRLLQAAVRADDRICRIGGDEFVVIFWDEEGPRTTDSKGLQDIETIARRFRDQLCRLDLPHLSADAPGPITISAGLATYPWDGSTAKSLLRHADQLALESKRRGKNLITLGSGAKRICRGNDGDDLT